MPESNELYNQLAKQRNIIHTSSSPLQVNEPAGKCIDCHFLKTESGGGIPTCFKWEQGIAHPHITTCEKFKRK